MVGRCLSVFLILLFLLLLLDFTLFAAGDGTSGLEYQWRPEESIRSLETGITASCELPDVSAEN